MLGFRQCSDPACKAPKVKHPRTGPVLSRSSPISSCKCSEEKRSRRAEEEEER